MKRFAILLLFFLFAAARPAAAQNCSPFMGIGAVQFLGLDASPLTNGALYVWQAGTSTQAPSYSDSACSQLNSNPVTFTTGGRATIWIQTGSFFKYTLCSSSQDGAACAAADQIFQIDNVPGGATGGGGSSSAPFISGSPSPATSGVLRLSSGDSVCWRNAAGSANLCWKKDSSDRLSWDGGSIMLPEVGAPGGVAGFDIFYADNTAHRMKAINNNGSAVQYVLSGNDIGTTDQVLGVHFGASQQTFGNTAMTTNQALVFNGTNLVGQGSNVAGAALSLPTRIQTTSDQTVTGTTMTNVTNMSFAVAANTNYSATCWFYGNAVTGGTAQIQWTGPASPASVLYAVSINTGTNAYGTPLPLIAVTTLQGVQASFALINGSNAGTVQLQMNNNTGGDGVLLKAGSYCIVQ